MCCTERSGGSPSVVCVVRGGDGAASEPVGERESGAGGPGPQGGAGEQEPRPRVGPAQADPGSQGPLPGQ